MAIDPQTLVVSNHLADSLTVILKKQGKEARQLIPFRQKCTQPVTKALMPGDAIYGTVLASAGLNGWDVAEPGTIRGDFATITTENLVHASDGHDSAAREIGLWFPAREG